MSEVEVECDCCSKKFDKSKIFNIKNDFQITIDDDEYLLIGYRWLCSKCKDFLNVDIIMG